jgi:hypothetical protein
VSAPLAAWETAWLSWARPVVRMQECSPEHFAWCRKALGPGEYRDAKSDPAADPALRWPGYVGDRWEPQRGVLFVGSVHADFTKDGRRAGSPERVAVVAGMVEANRRWRDLAIDSTAEDARYLKSTRLAYATLIPGWARDGAFGEVRRVLADHVDAVGWTNLAHCRARPQKTPGGEYGLQRACSGMQGAFPIRGLLDAIRPAAVLVSVSPVEGVHARRFDFTCSDGYRPLLWAFDGRTQKRGDVGPDVWAPRFAELVGERRAN